ncbi:MAG: zinc-ribbon domain-containing protein [Candidatus Thorarchaeota archaeon]
MGIEERICKNCGTKLDEGERTCPKCGRLHVDSARDRLGYEDRVTAVPPTKPLSAAEEIVSSEMSIAASQMELEEAEPSKHEITPEPSPAMEREELTWPTDSLAKAVNRLGVDGESTINKDRPSGVEDLTLNEGEQIVGFSPDIDLLGFDMRAERRGGTWGGVLARALENPTKDKRCLQYLYVYTRQHTVVSFFWMVFVPLLMLIWTFLVPFIFSTEMFLFEASIQTGDVIQFLLSPGEAWIPMLATGLVSLPLFATGLWPHVSETRKGQGSKFRFRSTTLLIFLGALMWGVLFNELVIWIMIIIWGVCTAFWRIRPTGHHMDYVPVFLWMKKDNDKWTFESAAWDCFHYDADRMSREELEEEDALKNGKHVQLLMDNPWHSLFLGSRNIRPELNRMTGAIVLFTISVALILGVFLGELLVGYTWRSWAMLGIFSLFTLSGSIVARFPSSLIKNSSDYTKDGAHLNDEKLRILWNLGTDEESREGRLVCVSKMQDPFSAEVDFTTFRESSE